MKKLIIIFLFLSDIVYPQNQSSINSSNGNSAVSYADVNKLDPRVSTFDFVPGQILTKFKDDAPITLGKTSAGKVAVGIESVDKILSKYQLKKADRLFPNEKRILNKRLFKTYNGNQIEENSLHNIYKLEFDSVVNIIPIIDELKQNTNVIYAEPNYILSIVDSKPVSPELTEKEMLEWIITHNFNPNLDLSLPPNDPLYSQQWYINAVHADSVWKQTTGDTTQVIAILDTGVDWLHPDLRNKIWNNPNEVPDNGIDDDGDGYVDDIKGWDWINNDNNPTDDNSHGTHVAGIVAAEANNGIGIAGINWQAKIMALKVFQSSGRGDAATISQAINYAATHGATVINMSFGTYVRSLTMEAALANAYSTSVLVAAAGNDNYYIGPQLDCMKQPPHPFYPAALSYVLGAQAGGSCGTGFSNYDDSPVYSGYTDLLNYEMDAPGTNIISTVPNGGYRVYQGTSMAAPIISGGVALYRKVHPADSQELMWGNLINSSKGIVKLNVAINSNPKPELWFVSNAIVDTLDGDKDKQVDAGETIELWFLLSNSWGNANKVKMKLRFGEFEDHSVATILRDTSTVGRISSYAKRTNETTPFKLKVSSTIANGRDIILNALCWDEGSSDTTYQKVILTAYNGIELSGVMDSTLILTPNKLWLINQSFRVGSKGKLIIRPGVNIITGPGKFIDNRGTIEAIGVKDSLIVFKSIYGDGKGINGNGGIFKYCKFSNLTPPIVGGNVDHCIIENIKIANEWLFTGGSLTNSVLINNYHYYFIHDDSFLAKNNFVKNYSDRWGTRPINLSRTNSAYNNFVNNNFFEHYIFHGSFMIEYENQNVVRNSFINHVNKRIISTWSSTDIINLQNQYWGTSKTNIISNFIFDFWDDPTQPVLNIQPFLISPSDSCHGIVWKVLVNGKDAQDEVVDPVGVGTHRFDVYFNREMDRNFPPQITFGVREPFTQQLVSLNASWSSDGKIYTAYKKVELYTGDGINRVQVSGARDLEDFEIPVEDMRFEFLIDAAGSASTDFLANAGIGKVRLEWPTPSELPTLLGYNIYRFTNLTDTTFTDPVQINDQLVTDTTYTDFKVEPHKKYYYKYKVVRTDFTESDFSKVVNATVLTASAGDANGSMAVDVMDIVSIVGYILNQNPQPFIYEAADINDDNAVNILDVVGVVNIILGKSPSHSMQKEGSVLAKLELKDNKLELQCEVAVCGIQFTLKGKNLDRLQFTSTEDIKKFESANGGKGDTVRTFIIYSLNNNVLLPGRYTLGSFTDLENRVRIEEVVISDNNGKGILTNVVDKEESSIPVEYYLSQNYPNPFNAATIIQYGLPKRTNAKIVIYNILGQQVKTFNVGEQNPGKYQVMWNGRNDYGSPVSSGVYIYRIETMEYLKAKKLVFLK